MGGAALERKESPPQLSKLEAFGTIRPDLAGRLCLPPPRPTVPRLWRFRIPEQQKQRTLHAPDDPARTSRKVGVLSWKTCTG